MNLLHSTSSRTNTSTGVLFQRATVPKKRASAQSLVEGQRANQHRLAFAGLYLLTLLMFVRPHELMPGLFGNMPLVKVVAISTMAIYFASRYSTGEKLITWPIEMKMVTLLWVIGLLLVPVAVSPKDSFDVLFDPLIKTLIVFILLINLITSRKRLRAILLTMVACGVLFSFGAIKTFLSGGYGEVGGQRIQGWGTMFSNPNDLACVLDLMLPFAVMFAILRQGWRRWFYLTCAVVTALAVMLTFSRSGFLGLLVVCATIIWKFATGRRVRIFLASGVLAIMLVLAMPGSYKARLATIFNPSTDTTNSAQERQMLMKRAAELALKRSVIGVGIGNFHVYSMREKVAHNSYLEITAELGLVGLIAYLILIFVPIRSLRRIEKETSGQSKKPDQEMHVVSICLQASLFAYLIYGFFGSVQYLYILYFMVAYAVAMRVIYTAEINQVAKSNESNQPRAPLFATKQPGGVLWQTRPLRPRGHIGDGS